MAQLPKCKGEGHVTAVAIDDSDLEIYGVGETFAKYDPDIRCRVAGTSGPGVVLGSLRMLQRNRGLHLQLAMAGQMPMLLRQAATTAENRSLDVCIQHTATQDWIPWRVLTVLGARDLASRIDYEVGKAISGG